MDKIELYNSLTRKEEFLLPEQTIKMYVCGITPYSDAHIGHGRCYVVFDILYKLFIFLGYNIKYVRNFTDIDDKLLSKAQETGSDYKQIADKFIKRFKEDIFALGCLAPTLEPRVTENIAEIISFIEGLIKKKKAYVLDNDVYFDIESFSQYGKLSRKNLDELITGARVDINLNKKNPADFALWKGNNENLFWKSPWGYGRPGWHIECSALVEKYLGSTIDIHGGGMDLIFPHHENEVAQSEALMEKPLSKIWIHNAFVNLNKEKMSKSLGNIFTLRELFKKYDPMILRFYFLGHHYRTPIDFKMEMLFKLHIRS